MTGFEHRTQFKWPRLFQNGAELIVTNDDQDGGA